MSVSVCEVTALFLSANFTTECSLVLLWHNMRNVLQKDSTARSRGDHGHMDIMHSVCEIDHLFYLLLLLVYIIISLMIVGHMQPLLRFIALKGYVG